MFAAKTLAMDGTIKFNFEKLYDASFKLMNMIIAFRNKL